MSFDPGLQSAAAAGLKVARQDYPLGAAGIVLSMDTVVAKIREGRLDPDVIGWARKVLHTAGIDGRGAGGASIKEQAQAILDAYRAQTVYTADPTGTETIQSAAATLCLRPGLCLNGGDCDDGCVAVGSALSGIGCEVRAVKQTFGAGAQEHVLLHVQDERGLWLAVDPSTQLPVGQSHRATREEYRDIMDATQKAELVTLGATPRSRGPHGLGTSPLYPNVLQIQQPQKARPPAGRWVAYAGALPRGIRWVGHNGFGPNSSRWQTDGRGHFWYWQPLALAGTTGLGPGPVPLGPSPGSQGPSGYGHWQAVSSAPPAVAALAPYSKQVYVSGQWWYLGAQTNFSVWVPQEGPSPTSPIRSSAIYSARTLGRVGFGDALAFGTAASDLANQVGLVIAAGDTYLAAGSLQQALLTYQAAGQAGATSVGPEIDAAGSALVTQPLDAQAAALNTTLQTATDATTAQGIAKQMLALYTQAIKAGVAALNIQPPAPPAPNPTPPAATSPNTIGTAATIVVAGVAVAGLALAAYEMHLHRPKPGSMAHQMSRALANPIVGRRARRRRR